MFLHYMIFKMKKNNYFEGWYLKVTNPELSIAFIPAYHFENNYQSASLQVIYQDKSFFIPFSSKQVLIHKNKFHIEIDKNIFSEQGIYLDIEYGNIKIKGKLLFSAFTPIQYDIMGPFRFIKMQCNHGVLSMQHDVKGELIINDKIYPMNHALGYIEKDWGTSFPKQYFWTQSFLPEGSIMVSIAHIPIYKFAFRGIIAIVYYNQKEYRFASYLNTKIIKYEKDNIIIKQRHLTLIINVLEKKGQPLFAPINGAMNHTIKESITSCIRYRFYNHDILVFDETCDKASYEYR